MNEPSILPYPHQVQKLLGIGTTKFYELVKRPDFPKPRNLIDSKRSIYLRKEIIEWANNLEKTVVKKGTGGRYANRRISKADVEFITAQDS